MDFLALGAESALCIWDAEQGVDTSFSERDQRRVKLSLEAQRNKGRRSLGSSMGEREREITGRL